MAKRPSKTKAAPESAAIHSEGQPPAPASGQDAGSNVVAVTAEPEPAAGAQALGSAASGQAAPAAETGEVNGADAAAAPDTDPRGEPIAIEVSARRDGFRRAGRAWSKEPVIVPLDILGEGELDALLAEPMLTVTVIEDEPA